MYASVYNSLKDYQNNLESKVLQRTSDLKSANDRLKVQIQTRIKAEIALVDAKKRADDANKAKTIFLSHMTHELRTPLNGIIGYSQILFRLDLEQSTKEYVSHINRCGEHLLALINNLLDLNKIESGTVELEHKPMNLETVLDNIMSISDQRAQAKGLSFNLQCSDDLPVFVVGDEGKLKQIIINLLGNAIKFTHKGEVSLIVKLLPSGNSQFLVKDAGQGIVEADQKKIFLPFGQSKGSTSGEASTGLGLSISRDMVKLMGGELSVESEPGKGSCFFFDIELPVAESEGYKTNAAEPSHLVDSKGLGILVVDDVLDNRLIMSTRLTELGFLVEAVSSAKEAYLAIEKRLPELVFMDIQMPEIDGVEATKMILSKHPGIKIIAFTASVHFEEFLKTEEHVVFTDFLYKPVHDRDLLYCLAEHLDLELAYENKEDARSNSNKNLTIEQMIVCFNALPSDTRENLKAAQRKGNMSKVRKIAEQIESMGGDFEVTGKKIQVFAQQYQVEPLNQVILGS